MNSSGFYLVCFIVGFALTMFSVLTGFFRIDFPGKWDNFLHGSGPGHGYHFHGSGMHGHHGGMHGHAHGHSHAETISPFNFSTMMAFLTWFGGTGYLLTRYSRLWTLVGLGMALVAGLFGGSLVFWFLTKFLLMHDKTMDPADFDLIGVIGSLTVPIRPGGTGEIVYSQGGTRKSLGACSEDGSSIEKGEEVAITRYEKGIAYVRRWQDLAEEEDLKSHRAE